MLIFFTPFHRILWADLLYFYRMIMRFFIAIFLVGLFACGDSGSGTDAATSTKDSAKQDSTLAAAKAYFPVTDFLKGEIRNVDSFSSGIKKYNTVKSKTDSTYIPIDVFKQLAADFISPDLDKANFEKNYKETSFFDQTTQSYTFTYSTDDQALSIQRVDVLVNPGDGFDKVKSVYLEKHSDSKDSSVLKKMYWKAGNSFSVTSQTIVGSAEPIIRQQKVIWGF